MVEVQCAVTERNFMPRPNQGIGENFLHLDAPKITQRLRPDIAQYGQLGSDKTVAR
jgi:hypothetical protein